MNLTTCFLKGISRAKQVLYWDEQFPNCVVDKESPLSGCCSQGCVLNEAMGLDPRSTCVVWQRSTRLQVGLATSKPQLERKLCGPSVLLLGLSRQQANLQVESTWHQIVLGLLPYRDDPDLRPPGHSPGKTWYLGFKRVIWGTFQAPCPQIPPTLWLQEREFKEPYFRSWDTVQFKGKRMGCSTRQSSIQIPVLSVTCWMMLTNNLCELQFPHL